MYGGGRVVAVGERENIYFGFFFNDTATTEIYTLSLHDALPIWASGGRRRQVVTSEGTW